MSEPLIAVGPKLRALRKERALSQRALAELSGVSINTVSLIERDAISPSVATLQHLARSLGVRMSYFFEGQAETDVICARAGRRPRIVSGGVTIEALGARLSEQQADPYSVTLAPHADAGARQVVHGGQELVCCLRGRVRYEVDGLTYDLDEGDFLLFRADLPHYWANVTEEPAEFLLLLLASEPTTRLARGHFPAHSALGYVEDEDRGRAP